LLKEYQEYQKDLEILFEIQEWIVAYYLLVIQLS